MTVEELLHLVHRAERGVLLPAEAGQLRNEIRALAQARLRLTEKYRILDRADALADVWRDDTTQISRSEAAAVFAAALDSSGWELTDPPPRLSIVPGGRGAS